MPEAPHSPAEPGGDPWSDIPAGGSIWFRESEHFFRPFSPLWETAWGPILHDTVKRATDDIGLPIGQLQFRLFHGYAYFRVVPFEGDRAERRQRREAALALCSDDLLSHWRSELLPRVQAHIDHMRQFDLRAASAEALEAHLDDALRRQDDAWYIHFYVFWVMMMLSFEYDAIAAEGGITGELLRAELVQDADNASLTGDNALAAVADAARQAPAVAAALASRPASDVLAALPSLPGGDEVARALQRFLDDYGDRLAGGDDWAEPTWREVPEKVMERVAPLVTREGGGHHDHRDLLARRDALTARTLASIADHNVRERFRVSLERMRRAWPLKEEHNFYIDQTLAAHMRYLMLEFGARLTGSGLIDNADDVFLLTFEEVRAAFRASASADLRATVRERHRRRQWQLSLTPPETLGAGTPAVEPAATSSVRPESLAGRAASAGRASGPARVILSIDDFGKMRAGDVLVCRSTTPHWTPLFQAACAVVAEAGGALSHAAIAAREYRIPAVLSVPDATRLIADGETLVVDGSAGQVWLGAAPA